MPDLSNLLGAVYGDAPSATPRDPEDEAHVEHEPAATERGPAVPDWADDEHLDAAFAEWKPGPSADASAVEHAFVADVDDDDPPPPLADDLAAALSEALVASSSTAVDTDQAEVDATAYGGPKPKAYDFSVVDDDIEPAAEVQPVHTVEPVQEVERVHAVEPAHEVEPVHAVEPVHDVADDVHDVEPVHEVPEDAHDAEPVTVALPVHDVTDVDQSDDVDDDHDDHDDHDVPDHAEMAVEDHLRHTPSMTPQRLAAAELTAASRTESESPFAPPSPSPDPEPVAAASAPVAATVAAPEVSSAAEPTASVPEGMRRWDRSDDDILPEKQSKKFFSLSLRRG